jgi:hypothetical protein
MPRYSRIPRGTSSTSAIYDYLVWLSDRLEEIEVADEGRRKRGEE